MPVFANAASFNDPNSQLMARGANLNKSSAIVDHRGAVVAYAQTGGMISPTRYELRAGTKLFRFSGGGRSVLDAAKGGWWIEANEFQTLVRFAQVHDIAIGMAMRQLCLVPPDWSDATLLVRARVVTELLAWRGLGNSVVTKTAGKPGVANMPHQNAIAARRVHQLFIPGLGANFARAPLVVEQEFALSKADSQRGFLYF